MMQQIPASKTETNRVMIDGIFLAIMTPVTIGTINNQSDIWNVFWRAVEISAICPVLPELWLNPMMVNSIKAINSDGMVVYSM